MIFQIATLEEAMKKSIIALAFVLISLILAGTACATSDTTFGNRDQADSNYRMARKAYRIAVRDYGESLEGLPEADREAACRQISSALYDNKWQYNMEDVFGQMKYKKQIQKLEKYQRIFKCQGDTEKPAIQTPQ